VPLALPLIRYRCHLSAEVIDRGAMQWIEKTDAQLKGPPSLARQVIAGKSRKTRSMLALMPSGPCQLGSNALYYVDAVLKGTTGCINKAL
jgi:hypothetical protein